MIITDGYKEVYTEKVKIATTLLLLQILKITLNLKDKVETVTAVPTVGFGASAIPFSFCQIYEFMSVLNGMV